MARSHAPSVAAVERRLRSEGRRWNARMHYRWLLAGKEVARWCPRTGVVRIEEEPCTCR